MNNYLEIINEKWSKKMRDIEDTPVLEFFKKNQLCKKNVKILDVGSGEGRFLLKLKDITKFDITALEINKILSDQLNKSGIKSFNQNFLENNFKSDTFDIVHCSHVIEHLKFPEIVYFLNELFRVTKQDGYVIIRSPLWHNFFYNDIDHVRPYPPEAINNFFNVEQQQIKGPYRIKEISRWYRRWPLLINSNNKVFGYINGCLALFWLFFRFPFSRKNGYVLILQKK